MADRLVGDPAEPGENAARKASTDVQRAGHRLASASLVRAVDLARPRSPAMESDGSEATTAPIWSGLLDEERRRVADPR